MCVTIIRYVSLAKLFLKGYTFTYVAKVNKKMR